MKNIAIPLLLANSAKADNAAKKKAMMMMDKMVPEPILIAAEYWENGCVADAVTAAADELADAQAALQDAQDARVALDSAVADAITGKNDAVTAVVEAEAAMADALADDDDAQQLVLTRKRLLDAANADLQAKTDDQAAKELAFDTATTAKSDAEDLLALMETAESQAADHYGKEQQQTIDLTALKNAANLAITDTLLNGGLTELLTAALTAYNTSKDDYYGIEADPANNIAASTGTITLTNRAKLAWDVALANKTKLTTTLTAATNALDASYTDSTDPNNPVDSIAKQVAAAEAVRDTQVADVQNNVAAAFLTTLNTEAGEWGVVSKTSTREMALWNVATQADETQSAQWTDLATASSEQGCDFTDNETRDITQLAASDNNADPNVYDEASCKALCTTFTAWTMDANDGNQPGNVETNGYTSAQVISMCYGVEWKAYTDGNDPGICKLAAKKIVTAEAGSGNNGANCFVRNKSTQGKSTGAAIAAAGSASQEWQDFEQAMTNWKSQSATVDGLQRTLDVATRYRTCLNDVMNTNTPTNHAMYDQASPNGGYSGVNDSAENDYNGKKAASDTDWDECCNATLNTSKVYLWNDATTALATKQAEYESLVSQEAAQITEEEEQLSVKQLADQDVIDQTSLIQTLTSELSDASDAKDDADTALSTSTQEQSTAEDNYNTAVDDAATSTSGIQSDVDDLSDKRGLTATAITTLNEALSALTDGETAIADAQAVVDEKTSSHLEAVVECKETNYDAYAAALADAQATRTSNLEAIEAIIDDQIAAIKAPGEIGARCEKALSNGTFRPRRDAETVCGGEANCCGAARIPVQNADGTDSNTMMTIETCQTKDTTTFSWRPPRGPMETQLPAAADYPFTCIEGAQKLAAAASALATAVYMLA